MIRSRFRPSFGSNGNAVHYQNDATDDSTVSGTAVFANLAAGEHTVQIYVRGSSTSCKLTEGNFDQTMYVEELAT